MGISMPFVIKPLFFSWVFQSFQLINHTQDLKQLVLRRTSLRQMEYYPIAKMRKTSMSTKSIFRFPLHHEVDLLPLGDFFLWPPRHLAVMIGWNDRHLMLPMLWSLEGVSPQHIGTLREDWSKTPNKSC